VVTAYLRYYISEIYVPRERTPVELFINTASRMETFPPVYSAAGSGPSVADYVS
jgi:hypothetical protein